MTSGTSSRKWVVFKSALKRFKWLSILYGVALFLEVPLLLWMELSKQKSLQGNLWTEVANKSFVPQILFHPIEHFVNIIVPVIFGLILFHYLQTDRASTFFHSLPIKRASHYCQNLFAGLTLIWLPILINGLLIYVIFAAFGVTEGQWYDPNVYGPAMEQMNSNGPNIIPVWQVMAYWLFLNLLMTGLFYVFTVFIGMLTGNVLLQGALTFIGLFLPLGLYLLIKFNLWKLLYGFPREINGRNIEWLSPLVSYLNNQNYRLLFTDMTWYVWYLVIAVLLCVISIYLYKRRPAEAAGETLAADWIRWIFKYGVAVCAALTGGLYFSSLNERSIGVLYLGYFIGAVLGYIVADMIAYKSFHFYKRWKGMAVFAAIFFLVIFSVKLDLVGYEKYVPDQSGVKEVFLSTLNMEGLMATEGLTGQDNIEKVRQLHRQIIKMEKENKVREQAFYGQQMNSAVGPVDPMRMRSVDITYVLDSGEKVQRTYYIDMYLYREFLYPIFNSQEAKQVMYGRLFKMDAGKIDQLNVNNHHLGKNIRIYKRTEIEEALTALRKDVLKVSYEAAMEGKVATRAIIEFIPTKDTEPNGPVYNLNYYAEFKNFEAFLAKYGYLEELFLDPADVSTIIVKKTRSGETMEVKDKKKIKVLLDWCSLEDENAFMARQKQPVNGKMAEYYGQVEYYGKIVKKDGSVIYVGFDSSPFARQLIYKMLNRS
ncbi:DUF6449 domain-containing protein [Thermincola potens]|uniref:ABC-2 type transport system permease protein n=1 Tax=Thermincola potens (strain JR) TaxID=635013 RepID=D5X8D6_THEPJ|nr:DUF6449 domain-containing protein [Thermincola potens]ADG80915.1 hypothetical protein TherJR_0019 [Thermincola potens JR]